MILDTSAVVAIIMREPGFEQLLQRLIGAEAVGIGAPTLVELSAVLMSRIGDDPMSRIAPFLTEYKVVVIPFGESHWHEAAAAYRRFGRGRHKAGLNFGDCLSYATARVAERPLLFVGDDFPRTDLPAALGRQSEAR